MTEDMIDLLQQSFADFSRNGEEGASLFYERLFALDPSLKALFASTDLTHQKIKLMAALGLVINSLRDFGAVKPVLENLAVRHVGYGVSEEHYDIVGTALIQALALHFGSAFTAELRATWIGAYQAVSGIMIEAARASAARVAAE